MFKHYYLFLILVFFLSGCFQKPADRDLNSIFSDYIKLNSELKKLDNKYADYLVDLCPGKEMIKLDYAENLFNSVDNWHLERKNIINKYANIIFTRENTTIKEFKDQVVVDELVKLTSNFKASEELIDYSFLQKVDCQIKYITPEEEYKKPEELKSCLIPCYELQVLAKNMVSLSEKGSIIIDNSKRNLANYI